MSLKRHIFFAFVIQLIGLAAVVWLMRFALNTDAVAYLRIGWYYAMGRTDLAVAGYWGPLLSWMMAPGIAFGAPPLIAARLAMAASGVIFFWGCLAVYRSLETPPGWFKVGIWATALVSVLWSAANITPDLLLAGFVALAVTCHLQLIKRKGTVSLVIFLVLGSVGWALAFLAKAAALPLMVLVQLSFLCLWRQRERKQFLPGLNVVICGWFLTGLLLLPWIMALSQHYGKFTITTTPAIAHAVAGMADSEGYHPFVTHFYKPAPSRVTSWEDPSQMEYHYWRPWDSGEHLLRQAGLVLGNLVKAEGMLCLVTLCWPWLLWLCVSTLARQGERRESLRQRWWWAAVVVGALTVVYLPSWLEWRELRFFYPAFPFLFVLAMEAALRAEKQGVAFIGRWGRAIVVICFLAPALLVAGVQLPKKSVAGYWAQELALRVREHNLSGPVAGSALVPGGRCGLYLAYFLNRPFLGDERQPTVKSIRAAQARLFAAVRGSALAEELKRAEGFENLDGKLFASASDAGRCPIIVFECP